MKPRALPHLQADAPRLAFTLTELLAVILTIALLSAVVLPALAAGKSTSSRSHCMNNLGQLARACLMYASDNADTYPTMKWRPVNPLYPTEMMRLAGNTPASGYDSSGGPYNLGQLWASKLVTDGRTFYCPANTNAIYTYNFYAVTSPWPYGFVPGLTDKNIIRSGYAYMPQLVPTTTVNTSLGTKTCQQLPGNGDYNNNPDAASKKWIALAPCKQSAVDVKHSLLMDAALDTLDTMPGSIPHHNTDGSIAGLNVAFPDGHVVWAGTNRVPEAYSPVLWNDIQLGNNGDALRHIISLFTP